MLKAIPNVIYCEKKSRAIISQAVYYVDKKYIIIIMSNQDFLAAKYSFQTLTILTALLLLAKF